MKWNRLISLALSLAVVLSLLPLLATAAPSSNARADKIEQALLDRFATEGTADFIVRFVEQADLSPAYSMGWQERGEFVVNALTAVAQRSQANAKALLDANALKYQTFIAGNELYVWAGNQQVASALADLPEVYFIRATRTYYVDPIIENVPSTPDSPNALAWGILDVKADQFWTAFGMQGDGIVVANIDTGVQYNHPALDQAYKCWPNPSDPACWSDPSNICGGSMCDNNGHGTHTMGTMVGDDDPTLTWQAGMAPNAQWIACKGCESSSCSEYALNTCADWIVAPGGNPANRPHVVNNSWGGGGCNNWYLGKVNAWRAAGIFPAFSAGNSTGCGSLGSPGDYQESFGTTGHDVNRNHYYAQGPSCFGHDPYTKPNITAPAYQVCSSIPTNSWSCGYSGTSMASPHSAGAVALLWSCNPSLIGQIDQTFEILQNNADPPTPANPACGVPPDNQGTYEDGYGYLNVYAAGLLWCGDIGYLEGYVTDSLTGNPIEGAEVTAVPTVQHNSIQATTDPNGYYTMPLMVGTYNVTAAHPHYTAQTASGVVIVANQTTQQDFALQPRGRLLGHVYDADNLFALEGATVTADDGTSDDTDAAGYYEMYLDPGTHVVTATMTDYAPDVATVEIISGTDTVQDFYLQAAVVFIPTPLHVYVTWQDTYNQAVTLTNRMDNPYDFEFREKPGGFVPSGGVLVQPPSLGTTGPVMGGTIADNPPPDWFADSPPAPASGTEAWALGTPIPSGPQFGNPMATTDGINFYLMGGLTSGGAYLNQTLHYDTATGVWTTKANMPTARNNTHAFYSPYDGKIYVPGGYLSGAYINNFDAYDPSNDTWQALTPLPEGKVGVQGGVVGNTVYVLGGNNNPTTCYAYNIDTATWSTCAPLPVGNYYGADAVYEDMIYVIGGWNSANFLRYDPATNTWQQGPSLPQARNSPSAAVSTDGILYIWGGGNGWTPYYDGMYYNLADWPGGSWTMISGDSLLDRNIRCGYACTGNQFWNTGGGPQANAVATNQFWDGMECYFPGGAGPDVPWFGQEPVTGTVPGNLLGSLNPTMYFTATPDVGVNQPGDYYCDLIVKGNPQLTVHVTMTVEPSPDLGQVHGYVRDNCTGAPLEEVLVQIPGGLITETQTNLNGYYTAWLYAGTYQLDFSLAGYLGQSHPVTITAGESVELDVDLVPDHPCIAVDPDMFEVWLITGTAVYTHPIGLNIYNDGGQDLNVTIVEVDGGFAPPLVGWKPAPLPAVYKPEAVADVAGAEPIVATLPAVAPVQGYVPQAVIYDNGPVVSHPGACSGVDASRLQDNLGMNTYGFGNQFANGYRMADDFVIDHPAGWQIDTITFFAYQTGSPANPSPITGVYYQIWNGPPNDPNSQVIFGDLVTNRLLSSTWMNAYRDLASSPCATNRPIMANVASAGVQLPAGTYWLDWMTDGSTSYTGPWAPPITIVGQTTTGNALQYTGAWAPALDSGTNTPQGMPFIIEGMLLGGDVPWFWEVPTDTVVPALGMDNVGIYFTALHSDTTPMPPGTYTATMMVLNNASDPVEIPVTMHIIAELATPELSQDTYECGLPGSTVTHTFILTNTGPTAGSFDIAVQYANWPATPSVSTIGPLEVGESETFQVYVNIPPLEVVLDSDLFTVTATYQNPTYPSDVAYGETCAEVSPGVSIGPDSTSYGRAGETVTYTLTVANLGDYTDHFLLDVGGATWTTTLSITDTGDLAPGATVDVLVTVQIPAGAAVRDSDTATITATSATDPTISDAASVTTEVQAFYYYLPIITKNYGP